MEHEHLQLTLVSVAERSPTAPAIGGIGGIAGPGWFDSSWDLKRGLEVCESWPADMRLHGWIEDLLQDQRTPGRTASPSASTAIA